MGLDVTISTYHKEDIENKLHVSDSRMLVPVDGVSVEVPTRFLEFKFYSQLAEGMNVNLRKNYLAKRTLTELTGEGHQCTAYVIEPRQLIALQALMQDFLLVPSKDQSTEIDDFEIDDFIEMKSAIDKIQSAVNHETQYVLWYWC